MIELLLLVINCVFWFWFGQTLNSINRRLGEITVHTQRQTVMLAAIANIITARQ